MKKHFQPLRPKHLFLIHLFFQARIAMITARPSIPMRGRRIGSGSISLSFVSAVVKFVEALLTNDDCVESDKTVTLLKIYKQKYNRYTWWWKCQMLIISSNIFITLFVWLEPIPCSSSYFMQISRKNAWISFLKIIIFFLFWIYILMLDKLWIG